MRLMGTAEIARALGVGRQRAYQLTRQKGFPDPLAKLEMGNVWDGDAVERWIADNRPAPEDQP